MRLAQGFEAREVFRVAAPVEHPFPKQRVEGSSPFSRSQTRFRHVQLPKRSFTQYSVRLGSLMPAILAG